VTREKAIAKIRKITSSIQPNESGCLLWPTIKNPNHRPNIYVDGRYYPTLVSRIVLEEKLGRPIREGYLALHTCDLGTCINEAHIYEGTFKDNNRDMVQRHWRFRKPTNAQSPTNRDADLGTSSQR